MKTTMNEDTELLIRRWIQKSQAAIKTAEDNLMDNNFEGSLNRIYYAVFYTVAALAAKENFAFSKHTDLIDWFKKKVYEENAFAPALFDTYQYAFMHKQDADYDAMYKPKPEEVKKFLAEAIVFIKAVRAVLIAKIRNTGGN